MAKKTVDRARREAVFFANVHKTLRVLVLVRGRFTCYSQGIKVFLKELEIGNMSIFKRILYFFLFFVPFAWVMHNLSKNFMTDPEFAKFLAHKTGEWNETLWPMFVRTHVVLAVIALVAGPFAFLKRFRARRMALHRTIGKIYIIAVLLNFLVSLYLAFYATGGWLGTLGFLALNGVWAYTTVQAYNTIRRKQVEAHRRWMIRSYATSLANTTLNVLLLILNKGNGVEYVTAYLIALWSCWLINLAVAELLIKTVKSRGA